MAESLVDLLTWLGMGGLAGAMTALVVASRRFAARLTALREVLESSLRDPRRADLGELIDQIKLTEAELKTLSGILKRVVAR
jgi:hypothetical protein